MSTSARQFILPDLRASCQLKSGINPHYKQASAASRAWINSYDIFTDRKRAFFVQGCNELLCSFAYPYANLEQLRTACDFVNLLFVVDEVSDEQNGTDARATGQVFVDAMKYPEWDDGSILAKITKEFRARFLRLAGPRNAQRFIDLCTSYTDCVATEAELRERGQIPDLASFIPLRRNNSAVYLCLSMAECLLGVDLDDKVYEDETFLRALTAVCDQVCWANDIYSYDMEQSKGLVGNNIVAVLMQENGTTLQETADYIGERCAEFVEQYTAARKQLSPSLGPDAARFIDAIAYWMTGNLAWSFETPRYFGSQLAEVNKTGIVVLRPLELPEELDDCSESDEE